MDIGLAIAIGTVSLSAAAVFLRVLPNGKYVRQDICKIVHENLEKDITEIKADVKFIREKLSK